MRALELVFVVGPAFRPALCEEVDMRVLITDDDLLTRTILVRTLEKWRYDVIIADTGDAAWTLIANEQPALAIVDWMMPGLDGVALCRRVRGHQPSAHMYLILLTARTSRTDIVTGLDAGADDYLTKPFDPDELRARLRVGERVLSLQRQLAKRVDELQTALSQVKQLAGLVPICCYCKRIRSDQNYWQQIESYISTRTAVQFSHGICPGCFDTQEKLLSE
jgi:CheY-like chemotaxis protein